MNVTLITFSQTGNTRKVAEAMAGAFRDAGHIARSVPLEKATLQDALTSDLLGMGTPCFSSKAPTPIKVFLRTLSPLNRKPAFVFGTDGGCPGRVLYELAHLLRIKGANVVGGFLTHAEVHHPAPCLIGRMPDRPDAQDLARARRFASAVAGHVTAGRPGLVADSRLDILRPKGGFYNLMGLISTDRFERLFLPEPSPDSTRCDQCKWCVDECPMHNITLQPYPVLGGQCIRCYRCLTGCPHKAFAADWRLGNLVTQFFYNTRFERWFGDLEPGETIY